jgi:hypothetical protein
VPLYSSRNSAPLEELATWLAQRWSDEFLSESPLHLYGTPTASKTGSVPGIVASPGARCGQAPCCCAAVQLLKNVGLVAESVR